MKFEQVLQLVEAVSDSSLTEFKYEEDGVKISLKREKEQVAVPMTGTVMAGNMMPAAQGIMTGMPMANGTMAGMQMANGAAAGAEMTAAGNAQQAAQMSGQEVKTTAEPEGQIVTSPLVGTFYTASSTDADAFVKVGDVVKKGQVLAIVEAMKLMNEIESEFDGTVAEVLVDNASGVEYGQPLFRII